MWCQLSLPGSERDSCCYAVINWNPSFLIGPKMLSLHLLFGLLSGSLLSELHYFFYLFLSILLYPCFSLSALTSSIELPTSPNWDQDTTQSVGHFSWDAWEGNSSSLWKDEVLNIFSSCHFLSIQHVVAPMTLACNWPHQKYFVKLYISFKWPPANMLCSHWRAPG